MEKHFTKAKLWSTDVKIEINISETRCYPKNQNQLSFIEIQGTKRKKN